MINSKLLVFVGVPGSGKSTIGSQVALELGSDFVDTDVLIEAFAGKSVQDIFVDDGEDHFREIEAQVVAQALGESQGVVALGGGAVLRESTRQLLSEHFVVWLDIPASVATSRAGLGVPRPVLLGNVRSQMAKLLEERRPVYESVADLVIDSSEDSEEATVQRVLHELPKELTGGGPSE